MSKPSFVKSIGKVLDSTSPSNLPSLQCRILARSRNYSRLYINKDAAKRYAESECESMRYSKRLSTEVGCKPWLHHSEAHYSSPNLAQSCPGRIALVSGTPVRNICESPSRNVRSIPPLVSLVWWFDCFLNIHSVKKTQ